MCVHMEIDKIANALNRAVEIYGVELAVLAQKEGVVLKVLNEGKLEKFRSLYNAAFFDTEVVRSLHGNLEVSILPQMAAQGNKYCYMGLIGGGDYIYGIFGLTDKTAKEQYYFSKEIDEFIHHGIA